MKLIYALGISLILAIRSIQAQALDIGGVEITIGENITGVLERLTRVYDVKFQEQMSKDGVKFWSVFEKRKASSDYFVSVGTLHEKAGRIVEIGKERTISDPLDLSPLYTLWTAELNQRRKAPCATTPTFWRTKENVDFLTGFSTKCGQYTLSLSTPVKFSDDWGNKSHVVQMFLSSP